MDNPIIINRKSFYNSWVALVVFIFLIIFQPDKMTFYAIRPADIWLIFCLILQVLTVENIIIRFRKRFIVKNYGFLIGVLAIVATIVQASYANLTVSDSFIFQFYRFLRFLLIFKFAENITGNLKVNNFHKFWKIFTIIGLFVIVLSWLEFYSVSPYKELIMDLYFFNPDMIEAYLINVERLAGVMGNANATAILLVCTLPYSLLQIANEDRNLLTKTIHIFYFFAVVYVLAVMTASRTAIFISVLIPMIIFIASLRRLKDIVVFISIILFLTILGVSLYNHFESKIVVQERIINAVQGEEDFTLSAKGLGKWANRYELWNERFSTFRNEGNQLAILIGLGYTKAYKDYADNGLISTFINTGTIGLILKLILFFIFIKYGFLRAIKNYRRFRIDSGCLAFALVAFGLLLWEFTADLTEHFKLGQLFYLFLSIALIINGKLLYKNSQ
jgi:hypothetical protein